MLAAGDERTEAPVIRPKRSQVARACDWCRLNRIKCDDAQPCKNCQLRGGECNNRRRELRTVPAANREIERLRVRIAELEAKRNSDDHQRGSPQPGRSELQNVLPTSFGPWKEENSKPWHWKGVWTAQSHAKQMQYYGPLSFYYFRHQIHLRLKEVIRQTDFDIQLVPMTASQLYANLSGAMNLDSIGMEDNQDPRLSNQNLTKSQEECFLNLFWQSYYCTVPILDGDEFQKHYRSLWTPLALGSPSTRTQSSLADIVLALCIQYGAATAGETTSEVNVDNNDASVGGWWLYRRCHALLSSQYETSTLSKLQSHIYSAIYLWNASFINMAIESLAVAICTAHALGLHHDPTPDIVPAQQDLYRRIWCTLLILDKQYSVHLGRPFLIHWSEVPLGLSLDNYGKPATIEKDIALSYKSLSSLEYHWQCAKFTLIARTLHEIFYDKCNELIGASRGNSLYDDPYVLETSARLISDNIKRLHDWARNVPKLLKSSVNGNDDSFSTSPSSVEMDLSAPLWLQRQRILLELLYHSTSMSLNRAFIRSSSSSISITPTADSNRHYCLTHAIAITNLIHHVVRKTTVLNGLYQVYDYQWEASIVMIGFAVFRPICPMASDIRKATQTAIKNLMALSTNNFKTAASAASILQDLSGEINIHVDGFQQILGRSEQPQEISPGPRISQDDFSVADLLVNQIDPSSPTQVGHAPPSTSGSQPHSAAAHMRDSPTPTTAEEFTMRMKAGFQNHDMTWLNDRNLDSCIMDSRVDAWDEWMRE